MPIRGWVEQLRKSNQLMREPWCSTRKTRPGVCCCAKPCGYWPKRVYRFAVRRAVMAKLPLQAHHNAVAENTHDPVIYMTKFLGTFSKKSSISGF